jgi:hypothetical protein
MSDQGSTTYRQSGSTKVRLALFWATNYFGNTDLFVIRRTKEMLEEHGLGLTLWPGSTKASQTTLTVPDRLVERADYDDLHDSAAEILSDSGVKGHLIVIFCQFRYTANGLTISDTPTRCLTRPFCLISPTVSSDNVTLLHEVGHAGGLDHDTTTSKQSSRNFMHEAEPRTTMMKWQIQKMATAFYSKSQ